MDHVIISMDQLFMLMMDSFWSIIGSVLLYTSIGLMISIALVLYIKRKKLARRENPFWNFMTNFHYLFVVSALLLSSPMLGGTRAVHHMINGLVHSHLNPTIETQVGQIQQAIVSAWPEKGVGFTASTDDTVARLLKTMQYTAHPDVFLGQKKAALINWLLDDLGIWIVNATVTTMASIATGKTFESIGLDSSGLEFSLQQIENTDYSQLGEEIAQSVSIYVSSYIDSFFSGFYLNIFTVLVLLMAIPLIEILFFNLWWKNRSISA